MWDLLDWKFDGDGQWRALGDPVFDDRLFTEMQATVDALTDAGVRKLAFVEAAVPPDPVGTERRRQRAERYNELLRRLESATPAATVIEFAAWTSQLPPDRYLNLFPDEIHTTDASSQIVWSEHLGTGLHAAMGLSRRGRVPPVLPVRRNGPPGSSARAWGSGRERL